MHRIPYFALLMTTLHIVGCGGANDKNRVPVYPVSGQVTMFGSPLANATVAFAPQENQPTAIGKTDTDGNFQLTTYDFADGAAVGRYKVVISKSTVAAGSSTGGSDAGHGGNFEDTAASMHAATKAGAGAKTLIPAQYTNATDTPLNAEVKPGDNEPLKFEIK